MHDHYLHRAILGYFQSIVIVLYYKIKMLFTSITSAAEKTDQNVVTNSDVDHEAVNQLTYALRLVLLNMRGDDNNKSLAIFATMMHIFSSVNHPHSLEFIGLVKRKSRYKIHVFIIGTSAFLCKLKIIFRAQERNVKIPKKLLPECFQWPILFESMDVIFISTKSAPIHQSP